MLPVVRKYWRTLSSSRVGKIYNKADNHTNQHFDGVLWWSNMKVISNGQKMEKVEIFELLGALQSITAAKSVKK